MEDKMRIRIMIGITIVCLAISTLANAQPPGGPQAKIEGAYEAVLTLPKATPTAILTFCDGGDPFQGAWLEEGGKKVVGQMTDKEIRGNEMYFKIQAGPGLWEFLCHFEGSSLIGTVTGDGATSPFEGNLVELEEAYCSK
jgi:hypothetical protein